MQEELRLLIERGVFVRWYITNGTISEKEISEGMESYADTGFRWTNFAGRYPSEFFNERLPDAEIEDYEIVITGYKLKAANEIDKHKFKHGDIISIKRKPREIETYQPKQDEQGFFF